MSALRGTWRYLPLDRATTPHEGAKVYVGRWWVHVPGKGLVFYKSGRFLSPQCNPHRATVADIAGQNCPGAEVIRVPVVFIPAGWDE